MKKVLIALLVVVAAMMLVYGYADAKVGGVCSNCHTMHNSQNSAPMVSNGTAYDPTAVGNDTQPEEHLLRATCVGCHSSNSTTKIATIGSYATGTSSVPIVYHTVAPSAGTLAGGDFYWVSTGDNNKGHNVWGISSPDPNHTNGAPGLGPTHHGRNCQGCHMSLAYDPSLTNQAKNGCEGCHYEQFHHKDPGTPVNYSDPITAKAVDPTYRYLTGHHYLSGGHSTGNVFVEGIEDSDWESTVSSTDHNIYQGSPAGAVAGIVNSTNHSISAFCAACHDIFHEEQEEGSAWIRHPVDVVLPSTGEYAAYDYINNYSPEAPVAFVNPSAPTMGEGKVMCLSCHRPHGSPNDDMLRWDYSTMNAGGGGSGGCFTCHSTKN